MVKMRLEGLPNDLKFMVENLRNHYNIVEVSKFYPNRNSKLGRIYVTIMQE